MDYEPAIVTLADKINKESRYYGLIIGIDRYEDPELADLSNPTKDAEKLFRTLTGHYTFHKEDITLLRNASRNDIVMALDNLASIALGALEIIESCGCEAGCPSCTGVVDTEIPVKLASSLLLRHFLQRLGENAQVRAGGK